MRPPLTGRPGLPLPIPGPSIPLPTGDPFDHPLFGLSLLHPRNRALAGALSKSWGETMMGWVEEEDKREEAAGTSAAGADATNCVVGCDDDPQDNEPKPDPEEDAETGKEIDPVDKWGELSRAGRALEKHGSRPGSIFPKARGNATAINQQGQTQLENIVRDPQRSIKTGNRFGGYDVRSSTGAGARFDGTGTFRGFLEP